MTAAAAPTPVRGRRLLVRLAARRDRVMVPLWIAVLVLVCVTSAAAVPELYPTEADRVAAAEAINASPGVVALYGPILDVHSAGELAMTKLTVVYAVLVALMLLFVVRRHTRLDEEHGRAELLGGTAVTATDPLAAALLYGTAVSVLLGVLAAAGNAVAGLPVVGSVAFGGSWAGTALVAAALTGVACQLSSSARTCAGIAATAILALFVVRAVGDTTSASWLSWLSPFGWNTQLRAYGDPRWGVLLLYPVSAAALAGVAWTLRQRRDLGSGLVDARPGPAIGSPRLADAIALNLRVHAPMLLGWTLGMAVLGLVFGAITPSFDAFQSPAVTQLLSRLGGAGAFRDTLLAAVLSVTAVVVTCFAIAVLGHGGADEQSGRTEQVLATATSRTSSFVATALVSLGGATWLLLVVGVTLALGVGGDTDHSFATIVASALAQAPAVWTVVALAALCYALGSRWAPLGWAVVIAFATLGQLGSLLGLPDRLLQLSPYTHAPAMPQAPFTLLPAVVLAGIAALVLVAAWQRFATRDIG